MELTSRPLGSVFSDGWLFRLRAVVGVVVIVFHGGGEERLPIAQGEKELLVVVAGVVAAVDEDEAELAGVGAFVQVVHGHGVGVIPAGAGRAGRELEAAAGRAAERAACPPLRCRRPLAG